MASGLGQTVAALARLREMNHRAGEARDHAPGRMKARHGFGTNPGDLRMWLYAPADLPAGSPLVVVLHGCGQGAEAYAAGAGWLSLADRLGFAVVAAEQTQANNANRCFNWFEPGDVARERGEAASIRQMVEAAIGDCDLDPARVFVTGLSAGGGMANAVMAAYPEVFAGGGIVAGLPYGAAEDVMSAFSAMFQPQAQRGRVLGERVRRAARGRYDGPWPRVSIWHGDADSTVQFANADEIAKQWVDVHGLDAVRPVQERVDGQRRTVWADTAGRPVVELYAIRGMGHGAPLASHGADGLGAPGPYLLEEGISSTARMAEFWGLGAAAAADEAAEPAAHAAHPHLHPTDVIAKALAAAGLIKR